MWSYRGSRGCESLGSSRTKSPYERIQGGEAMSCGDMKLTLGEADNLDVIVVVLHHENSA